MILLLRFDWINSKEELLLPLLELLFIFLYLIIYIFKTESIYSGAGLLGQAHGLGFIRFTFFFTHA